MSQSNLYYHFKKNDALIKALFPMIQDTFLEHRKQDTVDMPPLRTSSPY